MKEKGGRQRRKAGPGKRYIIDVRRGIILILVLMAVCMGCSPDRHEETDTEDRESGGSEQQETAEESENLAYPDPESTFGMIAEAAGDEAWQ